MNALKCHYCKEGTGRKFACCSHSFLHVFEMGFLQEVSHINGSERPIKLLNLTKHIGNETKQPSIFREQDFVEGTGRFFFAHPIVFDTMS